MCSLGHAEIGFEGSLESNEMIFLSSPCPRAAPAPELSLGADSSSSTAAPWVHATCPSFGKQRESNFDSPAGDPVVEHFKY